MGKNKELQKNKSRLYLLDTIRGFAILGMIFIHVSYDLPMIFGFYPEYLSSFWYAVFCQTVRITFIFLSGYCAFLGKHTLKRGLIVSAAGLVITIVTVIAKFDEPIYFGVLTLIGASMILSVPFKRVVTKKNAPVFFFVSLTLFIATLHIFNGYFGFVKHPVFFFPDAWYKITNPVLLYPLAFIGFPGKTFVSSDYFPLMPWFFLFMAGFSFYGWCGDVLKEKAVMKLRLEPMAFLGRYSLYVYLIHQPLLLGILYLIQFIVK